MSLIVEQKPSQPTNYQQELTITLDEAYHGTTRRIQIGGQEKEAKIPAGSKTGTKPGKQMIFHKFWVG